MPTIPLPRNLALPNASVRAHQRLALAVTALGSAGVGFGLAHDPVRTWSNVLVDGFLVLSLALGGLVFIAIHHLSGAAWSAGMRRIAEAMTAALPVAAVTMLALFFGRGSLLARAGGSISGGNVGAPEGSAYFDAPFVFSRAVIFLAAWMAFAALIRRASTREDSSADPIHHRDGVRYSAAFIVVFAVSFSMAAVDWILSLEPNWTSTIFPVYVFAGLLVEALAAITLVVVLLHERGHLPGVVSAHHLHDLGKLLFAFTTFWAYIWLSQYLLIWYSNLPEEISHYQVRTSPAWLGWFLVNLTVNWVIPFVVLLPRSTKRDPATLKWIAIIILLGRWLDIYLLVAPQTLRIPTLGAIEFFIALAYGGVTWHVVSDALTRRPLIVRNDPRLADCIRHAE